MRETRAALAALIALLVTAAEAGEPRRYFEATSDRRFDDVDYWKGVFEDPKRDGWQKPAEVVNALGLAPGMRVADLGAGTGYFVPHLSKAVGAGGSVYAVEVEPRLVVHLRERAEREGTDNVVPILASPDNPRLPGGGVDVVLVVDTFHHIDDRKPYLEGLRRLLSKRGRLVIIDWKEGELPVGPEPSHKIPREQVIDELRIAGYALDREPDVLPYQYFLVFRPRK